MNVTSEGSINICDTVLIRLDFGILGKFKVDIDIFQILEIFRYRFDKFIINSMEL